MAGINRIGFCDLRPGSHHPLQVDAYSLVVQGMDIVFINASQMESLLKAGGAGAMVLAQVSNWKRSKTCGTPR